MFKCMSYEFRSNSSEISIILHVEANEELNEDAFDILACEMLEEYVKNPQDFYIEDCWSDE